MIDFNELNFGNTDSKEEIYFHWFLQELIERGYIKKVEYHKASFDLLPPVKIPWYKKMKTKIVTEQASLLRGHIYTPDYWITWDLSARDLFYIPIGTLKPYEKSPFNNKSLMKAQVIDEEIVTIMDVKGSFIGNISSSSKESYLFSFNQKMVWDKYGIYIQKVVIPDFFKYTFTPRRFLTTDKSGKPRKIKFKVTLLTEYLKTNL